MQKHISVYLKHFDLGDQDLICCEACGREGRVDGSGFDIHHIHGRVIPDANNINNIMCLCRRCHDMAHQEKLSKDTFQYMHNNFLLGNRKTFIK